MMIKLFPIFTALFFLLFSCQKEDRPPQSDRTDGRFDIKAIFESQKSGYIEAKPAGQQLTLLDSLTEDIVWDKIIVQGDTSFIPVQYLLPSNYRNGSGGQYLETEQWLMGIYHPEAKNYIFNLLEVYRSDEESKGFSGTIFMKDYFTKKYISYSNYAEGKLMKREAKQAFKSFGTGYEDCVSVFGNWGIVTDEFELRMILPSQIINYYAKPMCPVDYRMAVFEVGSISVGLPEDANEEDPSTDFTSPSKRYEYRCIDCLGGRVAEPFYELPEELMWWPRRQPQKPTVDQIKDQIKDKPFALFADLDCDIVKKWLTTATHQVQQAQIDKLNGIVSQSAVGVGPGVMIGTKDVARVQKINDAYSTVVNMDYFPVTVTELPVLNGKKLSPEEFLQYIRKNINTLVNTDLSRFEPYNAYGVNDVNLWNSNNPLGAIVGIDIGKYYGMDNNGSVIVSRSGDKGWTFTTIHEPMYGDHPVSGNRDFGFTKNSDGSHTFYTRGVDRLTDWSGEFAQKAMGIPFDKADNLWRSFQVGIVSYVRQNGGKALWETLTKTEEIERPDWQIIKDVIDGRKPLSLLSTDCEN